MHAAGATAHILIVTGASGAGKTTTVTALAERAIPGVECFHFDSIGVPTAEVMEREHGGGEGWQAHATSEWLSRLGRLPTSVRVAVLDAQTRPSFVFASAQRAAPRATHVVLFDCAAEVRAVRLRGARGQPELANARMDCWAAYLRGQADALHLPVVETTWLTVAEAASQLEAIIRRVMNPGPLGLARTMVRLVDHEPAWAALFIAEQTSIRTWLGELAVDVQHVGSTAAPGLAAKPILDIAVAVRASADVMLAADRLRNAGYLDRGSAGREGGHLLVREIAPEVRSAHIHIMDAADPQWSDYLRFRDRLRSDGDVRQKYAQLKAQLAHAFGADRRAYTAGKSAFIRQVLA